MMNKLTYKNVHNRFKLNGLHFNGRELYDKAYIFVKEGDAHEKALGNFILEWFDGKEYIEMTTSGTTGTPKKNTPAKSGNGQFGISNRRFFRFKTG